MNVCSMIPVLVVGISAVVAAGATTLAEPKAGFGADFARSVVEGTPIAVYRFKTDMVEGRRLVNGKPTNDVATFPATTTYVNFDGSGAALHVQGTFTLVRGLHGETVESLHVDEDIRLQGADRNHPLARIKHEEAGLYAVIGDVRSPNGARFYGPVDEHRMDELQETVRVLLRTPYETLTEELVDGYSRRGPLMLRQVALARMKELGIPVRMRLVQIIQQSPPQMAEPLLEQLLSESVHENAVEDTLRDLQTIVVMRHGETRDAIIKALQKQMTADRFGLKARLSKFELLRRQLLAP